MSRRVSRMCPQIGSGLGLQLRLGRRPPLPPPGGWYHCPARRATSGGKRAHTIDCTTDTDDEQPAPSHPSPARRSRSSHSPCSLRVGRRSGSSSTTSRWMPAAASCRGNRRSRRSHTTTPSAPSGASGTRMPVCPNGVRYFMQHQVWKPGEEDPRGLGGDQLAMALSSWNLLHGYLGDPAIVTNMRYLADYYLAHGLSSPASKWPHLPFPYNLDVHSGTFDGDMRAGRGFLQPDKAGSFGAELVTLAKVTGDTRYLAAAGPDGRHAGSAGRGGDAEHSPWPYRVHVDGTTKPADPKAWTTYTTNWTGTLRLFEALRPFGARRHGSARSRARAREGVAGGASDEDEQLGSVLRGHRRVFGHGDQRRHDGAVPRRGIAARSRVAAAHAGHPRLGRAYVHQRRVHGVRRQASQRADRLQGARQQPHLTPSSPRAGVRGTHGRLVAKGSADQAAQSATYTVDADGEQPVTPETMSG